MTRSSDRTKEMQPLLQVVNWPQYNSIKLKLLVIADVNLERSRLDT
jgi:hypothetical protein